MEIIRNIDLFISFWHIYKPGKFGLTTSFSFVNFVLAVAPFLSLLH